MKTTIKLLSLLFACQAHAIPFSLLVEQAKLWRPQTSGARQDLGANVVVSTSHDGYQKTSITLQPVTKPEKTVATISYVVDLAEIRYISVDPLYQRQGIASVLLGCALKELKQKGLTRAQVTAEPPSKKNRGTPLYERELARSVAFYQKNGGLVESRDENSAKIIFDLMRHQNSGR